MWKSKFSINILILLLIAYWASFFFVTFIIHPRITTKRLYMKVICIPDIRNTILMLLQIVENNLTHFDF
jgi:hypothetical protein